MKNANVLVGQLRVMAAREQNEILREYLQQAVAALNSERGAQSWPIWKSWQRRWI